ncbi:MAG: hypothetical protein WD038_08715 [Balneolales bacterium]
MQKRVHYEGTKAYLSPVLLQYFSGATPGIPGVAPEKQRSKYGEA